MKIANSSTLLFTILLIAFVSLAGCEDSVQTDTTQARLVANENLQLKDQLKECNDQIQAQKEVTEQCELEKGEQSRQSGESMRKLLVMLAESETKLKECRAENAALKEQIKPLESQQADTQ